MNKCDIMLFHTERGVSRLIRWGTGSIYSHVAVCVAPDSYIGIEAGGGRVRAIDIRKKRGEYDIYRVKKDHPFDEDKVLSFLADKLDSKYDFVGVIWLGAMKGFEKFLRVFRYKKFKPKVNRFQIERDYFCSELAYEAFMAGGLDIVPQVPQSGITSPADISRSEIIERAESEPVSVQEMLK